MISSIRDEREDASALFQIKLFEFFPHEIDNKFQRIIFVLNKEIEIIFSMKMKTIIVRFFTKILSFILKIKLILIIFTARNHRLKMIFTNKFSIKKRSIIAWNESFINEKREKKIS